MKPRELLSALALVAVLAVIAAAQPSPAVRTGVEIRGPLDSFNLSHCFYRDMNISLTLSMENLLSPASPPWCPSLAPVDGVLVCNCGLAPSIWWPNATWLLTLPPGGTWSTAVETTVPGGAGLGAHRAGYECLCSWKEWCRYVTTSRSTTWVTFIACAVNTIIRSNTTTTTTICYTTSSPTTTTTTATKTSTTIVASNVVAFENVTVLPRRPGDEWLGFNLSCNFTEPGPSPCNLSIYNLALGLVDENETALSPNNGSIYLYEPGVELYVPEAGVMQPVGGWVEHGYAWSPSYRPPRPLREPAALIPFLLPVPQPPSTTVPVVAVVSAVADNTTNTSRVYTTTIRHTFTVRLGYGWNITLDDNCRTLNWVAVNETGVHTVILDTRPPVWRRQGDMILIEDPGMCGRLSRILVERGGGVYLEDRPRGRLYALNAALPPGDYRVIAVDQAGHALTLRLHVEPARQGQWLAPALVLLIVLAAVGVMSGRRWVRV